MYKLSRILNKLSALSVAAMIGLAIFSSCNNENEEPAAGEPREISFCAANPQASRATTDTEPLDPAYKMWVTSIYHNANNTSHEYHLTDMLFESKTVDGKTIWAAPGGAYYPLNGKVDFVAYASENGVHKPSASYYTSKPLPIVSDVEPYLAMINLDYRSSGLDGTDDVLVSAVSPGAPCGKDAKETVPLEFDHLLCAVRFVFSAETEEAAKYMVISSVELKNIRLSGIAKLERGKGSAWTISWPTLTAPVDILKQTDFFPVYNNSAKNPVLDFYFPPQDLDSSMSFDINFKYRTEINETEEMLYNTSPFSKAGIKKFEPGKRYTYNVVCKILPLIEFNITLVDETLGIIIDEWVVKPEITLEPQ